MHNRSVGYWARSGLIFVMHQIVATEGVIWLTIVGTFLLRGAITSVHEAWAHSAFMRAMHLVMSNTPFFPVQIALGSYIGWRLFDLTDKLTSQALVPNNGKFGFGTEF